MQKFLTNLLLFLGIMAVLLFFSPLSSMLDFWEPASPEGLTPIVEESVAEEELDSVMTEDIDVDDEEPAIETVSDTDADDTEEPEEAGEEAESEELPDTAEATETADELADPEPLN